MNDKNKKKGTAGGAFVVLLINIICFIPLFLSSLFPLDLLMILIGIFPAVVMFIVMFFVSYVLSIVIHESGHLVFGLLSGYGFSSFRIFNIVLLKTEDGMKIKRYSIPGTAGQCILIPPELNDGKMPTVLYNLGGSLLGFFAAAIFAICAFYARNTVLLYMFAVLLTAMNLSVALTNAIPMRTAMINNDGKNALSLRNNPEAVAALRIQLLSAAESSRGVSIGEMPEEWFVMPSVSSLNDPMLVASAYLCHERAFQLGEYARAKEIARIILDNSQTLQGVYHAQLLLSLAFIASMEDDSKEAERIFKKEMPQFAHLYLNNLSAIRTRYAQELLVKGNEKGARRVLCRFNEILRRLKNYAFRQEIDHELKLIHDIDREYADRQNADKTE